MHVLLYSFSFFLATSSSTVFWSVPNIAPKDKVKHVYQEKFGKKENSIKIKLYYKCKFGHSRNLALVGLFTWRRIATSVRLSPFSSEKPFRTHLRALALKFVDAWWITTTLCDS
jgi:hypothetical protein